jgi:hypothetical protein
MNGGRANSGLSLVRSENRLQLSRIMRQPRDSTAEVSAG